MMGLDEYSIHVPGPWAVAAAGSRSWSGTRERVNAPTNAGMLIPWRVFTDRPPPRHALEQAPSTCSPSRAHCTVRALKDHKPCLKTPLKVWTRQQSRSATVFPGGRVRPELQRLASSPSREVGGLSAMWLCVEPQADVLPSASGRGLMTCPDAERARTKSTRVRHMGQLAA